MTKVILYTILRTHFKRKKLLKIFIFETRNDFEEKPMNLH
jgi:hypothetical protein